MKLASSDDSISEAMLPTRPKRRRRKGDADQLGNYTTANERVRPACGLGCAGTPAPPHPPAPGRPHACAPPALSPPPRRSGCSPVSRGPAPVYLGGPGTCRGSTAAPKATLPGAERRVQARPATSEASALRRKPRNQPVWAEREGPPRGRRYRPARSRETAEEPPLLARGGAEKWSKPWVC